MKMKSQRQWAKKWEQARKARLKRMKMGLPPLHPFPGQERVWNRIKDK